MLNSLLKRYRKFVIIGILVVMFMIILSFVFFWWYLLPIDKDGEAREIIIEQGSGQRDIATQLQEQGLIRNKDAFLIYIQRTDTYKNLQAGTYELSPAMSVQEIVQILTKGDIVSEEIQITFPEGLTIQEMDELLTEKNLLNKGEFEDAVNISYEKAYDKYGYTFLDKLDDLGNEKTLEGFLFPDTYRFFNDSSVEDVVSKMLENFETKMNESFEGLIGREDFLDIVIIASMLQAELKTESDMKTVAGLIQNRIDSGMYLNIDSTIKYVTGASTPVELSKDIDNNKSDYNTYKVKGLPPTPIGNPGLTAIGAALNPVDNDYFYYINLEDGTTYYSKTFEEHQNNVNKYLK